MHMEKSKVTLIMHIHNYMRIQSIWCQMKLQQYKGSLHKIGSSLMYVCTVCVKSHTYPCGTLCGVLKNIDSLHHLANLQFWVLPGSSGHPYLIKWSNLTTHSNKKLMAPSNKSDIFFKSLQWPYPPLKQLMPKFYNGTLTRHIINCVSQ